MQTTTAKLYSLEYNNARTYGFSALFIAGNILLPQLCHTIHLGGPMLLPIYFFTLIGAYKYGWRVGLLTAVLSPFINSMLFGMPLPEVLPAILSKSILLAAAAGYAHIDSGKSLLILRESYFSYQVAGSLVEWLLQVIFHRHTRFSNRHSGMFCKYRGLYRFKTNDQIIKPNLFALCE